MKITILIALLATSMLAESPAKLDLEREVSHVLLLLPEHTVFDSIQFQVGDQNKVTLDGQVTNEQVKEAAERAVAVVPGVGRVVNNLKVQPLSESDDQVRTEVLQAIRAEPALKGYAHRVVWPVHVIVSRSAVTLEGVVNSDAAKTQAGVAANSVPAVSRVTNHLRVVPSQTSSTQSPDPHN